jgi:hypothetical protein
MPAVLRGGSRQVASKDGAAQAAARIDDGHPPFARLLDQFGKQAVVFEELQRHGHPAECLNPPESDQTWLQHLHGAALDGGLVGIEQVCRGKAGCAHA